MSSIKKTKSIIRANNTTAPVLLGGILTSSNAVATPLVYLLLFDAPFQIALDGTAFNPTTQMHFAL